MEHPRAEVIATTGPRVVARGVAVLPPRPRMLFWPGYVTEQALVVNVRGFGLVLRPEIAALSMSGSSFLVAVNALLLRRLRLPGPKTTAA